MVVPSIGTLCSAFLMGTTLQRTRRFAKLRTATVRDKFVIECNDTQIAAVGLRAEIAPADKGGLARRYVREQGRFGISSSGASA